MKTPFKLNNRYVGLKILGFGAQAIVYLGKCLLTNTDITIRSNKKKNSQFYYENIILDNLNKKKNANMFIPKCMDFITDDLENEHLVLEHVQGNDMYDWFSDQNFEPDRDLKNTMKIIRSVLECVFFCHSNNVAHLDIKPENIIMEENYRTRLIDFGCARILENSSINHSEILLGSTEYASPEIMNNCFHIKSDIWSVGIVSYLLLTGYLPYKVPIEIDAKDIESQFRILINTMLEKKWQKRPTASSLIESIDILISKS